MPNERIVFTATLGELAEVPGTPFAYWAPKSLRDLFQKYPPLDRDVARMPDKPKIADVKQGLATADDLRFTRYWWEVPVDQIATSREETRPSSHISRPVKKWVPFAKGGKPFYHDIQLVVNWENEGEEIKGWINPRSGRPFSNVWMLRQTEERFFFRAGLAWADIMSEQRLDMRYLPDGCIFAAGAHALFVSGRSQWCLLAFGNSSLAWRIFRLIEPIAHHKHIGYVAMLPIVPSVLTSEKLAFLAREAYDLLREWATGDETATVFVAPWILQVWDEGRGTRDEKTAMPSTGHPLARDFEWRYGIPQKALEHCRKSVGSKTLPYIYALAQACVIWESELRRRIEEIQRQIGDEVYRLYEISDEDRALIEAEFARQELEGEEESEGSAPAEPLEDELTTELSEGAAPAAPIFSSDENQSLQEMPIIPAEEHIKRLVHYLAHQAIKEDPDGIVPLQDFYPAGRSQLELGLPSRVRAKLREIFGEEAMGTIEGELQQALGKSLDEWLATDFFGYHVGLYRLRPIIWQIVPPASNTGSQRSRRRTANQSSATNFSVFIYWHKLDSDTLPKVKHVYLQPFLDAAEREVERLEKQMMELQSSGATMRQLSEIEQRLNQARVELNALKALSDRIDELLKPHSLRVESRSEWVKEKVNEIVSNGYKPNLDYGVRVNIEPLKQKGILPRDAERVRG